MHIKHHVSPQATHHYLRETQCTENETHVQSAIQPEGLLAKTSRCPALNDLTPIAHQARKHPRRPLRPKDAVYWYWGPQALGDVDVLEHLARYGMLYLIGSLNRRIEFQGKR